MPSDEQILFALNTVVDSQYADAAGLPTRWYTHHTSARVSPIQQMWPDGYEQALSAKLSVLTAGAFGPVKDYTDWNIIQGAIVPDAPNITLGCSIMIWYQQLVFVPQESSPDIAKAFLYTLLQVETQDRLYYGSYRNPPVPPPFTVGSKELKSFLTLLSERFGGEQVIDWIIDAPAEILRGIPTFTAGFVMSIVLTSPSLTSEMYDRMLRRFMNVRAPIAGSLIKQSQNGLSDNTLAKQPESMRFLVNYLMDEFMPMVAPESGRDISAAYYPEIRLEAASEMEGDRLVWYNTVTKFLVVFLTPLEILYTFVRCLYELDKQYEVNLEEEGLLYAFPQDEPYSSTNLPPWYMPGLSSGTELPSIFYLFARYRPSFTASFVTSKTGDSRKPYRFVAMNALSWASQYSYMTPFVRRILKSDVGPRKWSDDLYSYTQDPPLLSGIPYSAKESYLSSTFYTYMFAQDDSFFENWLLLIQSIFEPSNVSRWQDNKTKVLSYFSTRVLTAMLDVQSIDQYLRLMYARTPQSVNQRDVLFFSKVEYLSLQDTVPQEDVDILMAIYNGDEPIVEKDQSRDLKMSLLVTKGEEDA